MTKSATAMTLTDVQRSRSAVQDEIAEAVKAHDKAAYTAATQPSDGNRLALSDARRLLGDLRAELEGMEAVEREAAKRARVSAIKKEMDDWRKKGGAAMQAVDETLAAYARVDAMLCELWRAISELREFERVSFKHETACRPEVYWENLNHSPRPYEPVFQSSKMLRIWADRLALRENDIVYPFQPGGLMELAEKVRTEAHKFISMGASRCIEAAEEKLNPKPQAEEGEE